ncbi:MAG: hypothetical protein QOD75_4011 [Blastocatellia bacterium]|jgi:hypothetical protein|nr:hypothetical protein [Blastocatellia bacterium]
MFIATNLLLKYSSLREERNVSPAAQRAKSLRSSGAPANTETLVYKHVAPPGRSPTGSPCCTSKLNLRCSD